MLRNRAIFGLAGVASAMLLSATGAFAQNFTFSTVLGPNGAPTQGSITGSTLLTTQAGNNFTYINGGDASLNGTGSLGSTNIVLTNYNSVASSNLRGDLNANYLNAITLTDANGQTATRNLTGNLSGAVIGQNGASAPAAALSQTFTSGPLTFAFTNGTYVIDSFSFSAPGAPGGSNGSVGARVTFTAAAAPEPGTVALLGTGLLSMAGMVRLRRRN